MCVKLPQFPRKRRRIQRSRENRRWSHRLKIDRQRANSGDATAGIDTVDDNDLAAARSGLHPFALLVLGARAHRIGLTAALLLRSRRRVRHVARVARRDPRQAQCDKGGDEAAHGGSE